MGMLFLAFLRLFGLDLSGENGADGMIGPRISSQIRTAVCEFYDAGEEL